MKVSLNGQLSKVMGFDEFKIHHLCAQSQVVLWAGSCWDFFGCSLSKDLFFSLVWFSSLRFLFVLLGPEGKAHQYHEIGRSMATLMTDEV